jgi:hypothetical protein
MVVQSLKEDRFFLSVRAHRFWCAAANDGTNRKSEGCIVLAKEGVYQAGYSIIERERQR